MSNTRLKKGGAMGSPLERSRGVSVNMGACVTMFGTRLYAILVS